MLDILLFTGDVMMSKNKVSPYLVETDNLVGEVEINNHSNTYIITN